MKEFLSTSHRLNMILVEHNLVMGANVCVCLRHMSLQKLKIPTNRRIPQNLVGESMAFTMDDKFL